MELPLLEKNTQASCPQTKKEIAEYLSAEEGERIAQKRIKFVRTARIEKTKYWLWEYEVRGETSYVVVYTVRVFLIIPTSCVCCHGNRDNLGPEDFLRVFHEKHVRSG